MGRTALLAGAFALALAQGPAGIPAASAQPETHCSFAAVLALAPGLSFVPSVGTIGTVDVGTVEYDGPVRGKGTIRG
jgi:hypothetical protein